MASCVPCEPDIPPAFYFSRGPGTFRVPRGLPAASRAKLVAALASAGHTSGIVLLRGGTEVTRYDSDHEPIFRQESYFAHLFAVKEPDCWGLIELPTGRATLFIPRLAPEYAIWMGEIKRPSYFEGHYGVDAVHFVDELRQVVAAAAGSAGPIHVMAGKNTDSGLDLGAVLPTAEGVPEGIPVDSSSLYNLAAECRVVKSAAEIEVMRYAAWVSSCAHASVMRDTKPGMFEYQLEALFLFHCAFHGGCRHQAYTCICACGPDAAVLHYGHAGAPNERQLLETDMALLDMGCEYSFYASDITCSFPISGEWTHRHAHIGMHAWHACMAWHALHGMHCMACMAWHGMACMACMACMASQASGHIGMHAACMACMACMASLIESQAAARRVTVRCLSKPEPNPNPKRNASQVASQRISVWCMMPCSTRSAKSWR